MKFPKISATFVRTLAPLSKIVLLIIGVFALCFFVGQWGAGRYFSRVMEAQYQKFSDGMNAEIGYLSSQAEEIAQLPALHSMILSKDSDGLIALIQHERIARK